MYIGRLPFILKEVIKKHNLLCDYKSVTKSIYLTFDDGPTPDITDWVLEELRKYSARATFFVLGKNAVSYPDILNRIIEGGHLLGNHTYSHKNGWETDNNDYVEDIEMCNNVVRSKFFRPPYGKITPNQIKEIKKKYRIVMWSILSMDYDNRIDKEKYLKKLLYHTKSGSIVVFHDSVKAYSNLRFMLPAFLEFYSYMGYKFEVLKESY